MAGFDFDAFRAVLEARDVQRWLPFYADDAEWLEYRHTNPPRSPNVMRGHAAIGRFLADVAASELELEISNEALGDRRAAFPDAAVAAAGGSSRT